MQVWVRHTVSTVLIAGFVTGMAFLGRAERMSRKDLICDNIVVEFADNYNFLNDNDVKAMVLNRYGTIFKTELDSLDIEEIERCLCLHKAIKDCQVWTTYNGELHVKFSQRKPVVRFMDGEEGFYADNAGNVFPLYQNFVAKAPVVTGPLPQDSLWISKMSRMANFISLVWEDKVDSIGVSTNGELSLKLGTNELFIFGQPDDYMEKFNKAKKYFNSIKSPDKEYTTIDLTYNKQIICR